MRPSFRLTFLTLALTLAGICAAEAGTLQQVFSRGELRVGISLAPPWAMRDADGELAGFEVEVARKLASDMDVDVLFLRYGRDELVRALEAGEIDLIAAGLTITPERMRHVNFSQPYAVGGIGIATNLQSTADVERFDELNDPDFTVAVIADSVGEDLARRIMSRARIVPFDDENEAADALVSGDVDIYLDEEPIPTFLALENADTVDAPLGRPLLETRAGFAVIKGDPDFLALLNAWIEAREADTWLPTSHEYWFGTLQWQE
jgi:polar amino acid transport system substrate-binding protein